MGVLGMSNTQSRLIAGETAANLHPQTLVVPISFRFMHSLQETVSCKPMVCVGAQQTIPENRLFTRLLSLSLKLFSYNKVEQLQLTHYFTTSYTCVAGAGVNTS